MRRTLKRKNILEVLYHYAKFGGVTPPGAQKMLSILSICPSRSWTVKF